MGRIVAGVVRLLPRVREEAGGQALARARSAPRAGAAEQRGRRTSARLRRLGLVGILRRLVALLALAAAVGAQAGVAPPPPPRSCATRATPTTRPACGPGRGAGCGPAASTSRSPTSRPHALETIYLRLWSNGVDGCDADAIEIWDLTGGSLGTPALDCTEVPVTLTKALAQGERATISMRLRITLPRRNDRFGYAGGLALVGTALPTLEVHDDLGWHHDAFEDLGESLLLGDRPLSGHAGGRPRPGHADDGDPGVEPRTWTTAWWPAPTPPPMCGTSPGRRGAWSR